jgi:hypothetical protein
MNNFLRESLLRVSIVIVLLIVGSSIAYYFAIFLPALQQQNSLAAQRNYATAGNIDAQQKCADRAAWFWKDGGYDRGGGPSALVRSRPVVLAITDPCEEQDSEPRTQMTGRQHHPRLKREGLIGLCFYWGKTCWLLR